MTIDTLKVRELISILKKHDPDSYLCIQTASGYWTDLKSVALVSEEGDEGTESVVVLRETRQGEAQATLDDFHASL